MKRITLIAMMALMGVGSLTAKNSTTLPIAGEVVKATDPLIQYVGRVSFAKDDVASFNFPGTSILICLDADATEQAAFETHLTPIPSSF